MIKTKKPGIVRNLLFAGLILIVAACNSNTASEYTEVKVVDVEQVGTYTYLLVKAKKGPEYWIAVPTMLAEPGETYQYQGGLLMEDFHSEELDRTFESVLFLESLISDKTSAMEGMQSPHGMGAQQEVVHEGRISVAKSDVKVEAVEGTITIAELFSKPSSYEGKSVRITGEVTKFNAAIMDRNWVHIQDGTEHEGKYDLTATSAESFQVGSTITIEGVLALNKDFGYGYSYELLLEEAKAVQ